MLDRKTYFIKEHVGLLKLSNTYDILDPQSGAQLGVAQEKPGTLIHLLRLLVHKTLLPTKLFIYTGNNPEDASALQFSIHKGFALFRPRVEIQRADGTLLGWFQRKKILSLSGVFAVFSADGSEVASVKGDWKGWNFTFLDSQGKEMGRITKKWAGLGKELFTSADQYMIDLNEEPEAGKAVLLLAAGLAVDTIYKEN